MALAMLNSFARMTGFEEQTQITGDAAKVFDFLKSDVPHITKIAAGPKKTGHAGPGKVSNGPTHNMGYYGAKYNMDFDFESDSDYDSEDDSDSDSEYDSDSDSEDDYSTNINYGRRPNYMAPHGRPNMAQRPNNMAPHGRHNMAQGPNNMAHYEQPNMVHHWQKHVAHQEPAQLAKPVPVAPRVLKDVATTPPAGAKNLQDAGLKQFEIIVFGKKLTVKLTPQFADDKNKSLAFSLVQEGKDKKNTAFMAKLAVKDNKTIVWSLQGAGAYDASPAAIAKAKMEMDVILRALSGYAQSASLKN